MRFRIAHRGSAGRHGLATALLLSSLAALTACTTNTGPIIPTGEPNQYTVTGRSSGVTTSWVQLKVRTLDQARNYCTSQGLKMTKPDVSSNHATGLMRQEAYVTFNCEPIPQPKSADQDSGGKDANQDAGSRKGQGPAR